MSESTKSTNSADAGRGPFPEIAADTHFGLDLQAARAQLADALKAGDNNRDAGAHVIGKARDGEADELRRRADAARRGEGVPALDIDAGIDFIAGRRGTASERVALQAVEWMLTAELMAIEKRAVELRNAIATVKGIAAEAGRARSEESDHG